MPVLVFNRKGLAETPCHANIGIMLNISSILIGIVTLILAIFAFIPLLGWANWIIIPFAVIGLALGAMSDKTAGRNLNIVVIVIGIIRLMLGGGFI
jgi:ABC-type transport system involved in cytochrome c biogenesis permease subunit